MKLFGKKNDAQTPADTGGDEAFDSAGMEAADGADGFDESHDDIENAAENGGDKQLMAPSRKISGAGGNRKTIMLGGGLVAVIALLGGGYYFMMGDSSVTPPAPVAAATPATDAAAAVPPQPEPAAATPVAPAAPGAAPAAASAATPGAPADPFAAPAGTPPAATVAVAPLASAQPGAPDALGTPPTDEKSAIPANQVATGASPVTPAPEETTPDMPPATLAAPQVPLATAKPPAATDLPIPVASGMETAPAKPADAKPVDAKTAPATKAADAKTAEPAGEAAPAWATPGVAVVPGTNAPATTTKTSSPSEAELAIVQNSAVLDQLTQPAKTAAGAAAAAGNTNMPFDPKAPKPAMGDTMKSVEQILEQQAIIRPVPDGYVTVRKEADSTDMDSRLISARTALGENRNAAALQLFDSLHSDYPKDKRIAMGRAVALQKTGQTDSALNAYEDVLNHDPKNLQALTNMLGLLKAKDPQLALEKLVQLHEAYPYQPDVAAQLGVAYGSTGNYTDAAKYLDLADALNPGSAYVIYNRAVLYDKMGNAAQAGDLYRQLIRMSADGTLDQPLPIDTIRARLSTLR